MSAPTMSVSMDSTNGLAFGWNAYRDPRSGMWDWAAYGPNGTAAGTARDRETARLDAIAARDRLR